MYFYVKPMFLCVYVVKNPLYKVGIFYSSRNPAYNSLTNVF